QQFEQHFTFWNTEKYTALSKEAVHMLSAELGIIKSELNLTDEDFVQYHTFEMQYLNGLKDPAADEEIRVCYLIVLTSREASLARAAGLNTLTGVPVGDHQQMGLALNHAQTRVDSTYLKLQHAETLVSYIETQLGIEKRWDVGGSEYDLFKQEVMITNYCAALNELERLVVMCLFELSKAWSIGNRYQINKALQRRLDTIRNAITHYNTQADAMKPPHPKITWKEIADYGFLGECDLLHHSSADIRAEEWMSPACRQAIVKFFKLCRAHEELARIQVEVR
ncbi:hypothetical protein BU15DRAFT_52161, partial [Melanogaster broomeanus]